MTAMCVELPVDIPIGRSPILSVTHKFKPDHVLILDMFYDYPMNHQGSCTLDIDRENRHPLEYTRLVVYCLSCSS